MADDDMFAQLEAMMDDDDEPEAEPELEPEPGARPPEGPREPSPFSQRSTACLVPSGRRQRRG